MTMGISEISSNIQPIQSSGLKAESPAGEKTSTPSFQDMVDKHLDEIARAQVAFNQYRKQGRHDLAQGAHQWAQKQRVTLQQLGVQPDSYQAGVDLSPRFTSQFPLEASTAYNPSVQGRVMQAGHQLWASKMNQAYHLNAADSDPQVMQPVANPEPSMQSPKTEQKPLAQAGPLNTAPPKVKDYIERVAKEVDIDPHLLAAIAHNESGFRLGARSSAGAIGLFQLMPSTAKELGVNPHDPYQNVLGGAKYIKDKINKYKGDLKLALAAYNAGPGNVDRAIKKAGNVTDWETVQNYLPRETQRYVPKVLGSYI